MSYISWFIFTFVESQEENGLFVLLDKIMAYKLTLHTLKHQDDISYKKDEHVSVLSTLISYNITVYVASLSQP